MEYLQMRRNGFLNGGIWQKNRPRTVPFREILGITGITVSETGMPGEGGTVRDAGTKRNIPKSR
jgi:hypothetical protein